jgi:hypothetical protein
MKFSMHILPVTCWVLALILSMGVASGAEDESPSSGLAVAAAAWPEADIMFHRDPQWLGGDDAYSLDLGGGRVAWFFGDSFVAPTSPGERRTAQMVHNSIGLQEGYDPTTAHFKTYWRNVEGKPASFFPDDGNHYFWPGGSILVDGKLLVFFMQAWTKDPTNAMGFATDGWAATLIDNPGDSPSDWRLRRLDVPQNDFGILVGSASLVRDGNYLVAFSVGGKSHQVFLIRWPWKDVTVGDLSRPEWWDGMERGWVPPTELSELPTPIMEGGQTEFSVIHSPDLQSYLQFQFLGFPVSPIGMRSSETLTGPWSKPTPLLKPEKLAPLTPGLMLYAVKTHPEQKCDGLALTYASNTHKLEQLLDSATIYFPQFVRVKLERPVQ